MVKANDTLRLYQGLQGDNPLIDSRAATDYFNVTSFSTSPE